jgi:uncharacterized membrane protein
MATTVSLPARFYAGILNNTETGVWTVPAAETDVVTSITAQNLTLVAQTFNVKMAGVFLAYQISLPPQTFMTLDIKQVLNTAESIQVTASNNAAVSMFISGVKITSS